MGIYMGQLRDRLVTNKGIIFCCYLYFLIFTARRFKKWEQKYHIKEIILIQG